MDKLKTRILLISVLLLLLFSVQSVAAVSDDDGNLTSESIDLSICDNTGDINSDKPSNNPDNILNASNELNVLGADEHTFSELADEIRNGGNTVVLKYDHYIYDGSTSAININGDNRIIDGKGAVIDMMGSTIRAFNVGGYGVTIKNLTIKNANFNGDGGAIYFSKSGTVENCNFTNNSASNCGGAVFFSTSGTVTNCNFTNNSANLGGAIWMNSGSVENCNFTDNEAKYGGAIEFERTGTVTNCNFTNNTAIYGGAIDFERTGTVTNCNFTDNQASGYGGAVHFWDEGTVTNCNFTGNNAITGSAIYFYSDWATKTVSNSRFLNNLANAETLEVTKNDNNITITFTGTDNLLNAIYSRNDAEVTFTNVTYWSANGIANTDSSTPSRSNREAGQNITLEIYGHDGSLVDNVTLVTDDNGQAIYDLSKLSRGKYKYNAYHLDDSYYTYVEKNDTFAKGMGDFNILQSLINRADADSVLTLDRNYTFTIGLDENLTGGIVIDKPITINGNGYTINALQKARIFNVTADNVVLNNITFTNAITSGDGGAVYFGNSGSVINCNFAGNNANYSGGAIYFAENSDGSVINCNFTANQASVDGGAVYFWDDGTVTNCNFTNNNAEDYGGAIWMSSGSVTNCNFTNNQATGSNSRGGAIYMYSGSVENCNFTNNTASRDGGAIRISSGSVENCNFTANQASVDGGAVYFWDDGTVTNCNFTNNNAEDYGGAVYFDEEGTVTNCNFTGNNATTGSAIYFWSTSATKTVSNSCFLNNRANAETLEVTKNDNNITITFTGNDNLLNAIYSRNDAEVTFSNVTYWSANGIAKTGSSAIKPSRSNKEAGQNITVSILVNDKIVLSEVYLTNENGTIVLDIKAGDNYFIGVRHDTDSYYTEKVNTTSNNTKFHVNVTSQTTNNKTVNITAKSNIPDEVIKGKLLFILPNSTEISANYGGNGTWWAVHTFDDYEVYEINASYTGLDNVTVNNGTVTISKANSTISAGNKTVTYPGDIVLVTIGENCTGINKSSVVIRNPDGTTADANVNVDGFTITIRGLGAGNYTVYYNNTVNSDWNGAGNFTGITVLKANSSVKADDIEVIYGDSIVVIVTSENATGVSYKVIGKDGVVKEGSVNVNENITGLDLAAGEYTVNLTTMVNCNYTSSNYTSKITVKPANSTVKAEDVEVTYGDSIEVVVTSENATKVSYQIISSGTVVKEGTINVNENITGLDLAAGEYTVNLTTMVNGNYSSSNYTSKITVIPANSTVKAEDVEVTYGDSIEVVVTSENATKVSYQIISSGTVVKEGTINVNENITGLDLAAGEYTVNLTTMVNNNYTSSNYTSKITVKPAGSSVSAEDAVASFGDAVSIPVSSVNATEVSYKIIDSNDKTVVNGTVKLGSPISVSDLVAGDYTVSLTTVVDENHSSVSNSFKLHIRHVVSITIAPVTGHAGEVISFTAQFKYENGDPVSEGTAGLTIKYEDKEILAASRYSILSADESVPVSNGKATFNVKVDNPGTYPYAVTYSGGDADDVQAESTLTILKVNTTVSGVDISGKPDDKKDVTVTVLDHNNNPVANGTVTLTLNGKTYNSTVENGKAVLSVELPNPGEYNATVTYIGNDHYDSSSSSISVNVEKVNTKAPSAEDVSGKAGEKKDIKVKIVDEKGNPVKNGTATLTVDGKTYTAEVIDGVATFKDVVIPDKDTVADVYYHGNDYYNASSATFSIKVKQDNNNTVENKTDEHSSTKVVDGNPTGNPIAMMLLALCAMVITYRKKIKL